MSGKPNDDYSSTTITQDVMYTTGRYGRFPDCTCETCSNTQFRVNDLVVWKAGVGVNAARIVAVSHQTGMACFELDTWISLEQLSRYYVKVGRVVRTWWGGERREYLP